MWTTLKADVDQSDMDLECIISGPIQQDKIINKNNICMRFYNETKPLYLETDASRIVISATLLQTRDGMTWVKDTAPHNTILGPIMFASKALTSAEQSYSNIEREALGILHGLEKFHHYCFAREESIITDNKPLVVLFKKDVATLSQWIQYILLQIHQYREKQMKRYVAWT